jgi:hypothetical protein
MGAATIPTLFSIGHRQIADRRSLGLSMLTLLSQPGVNFPSDTSQKRVLFLSNRGPRSGSGAAKATTGTTEKGGNNRAVLPST